MKKYNLLLILIMSLFSFESALAVSMESFEGRTYTLPNYLAGVHVPVISLNGKWGFKYSAQSSLDTVKVPGEVTMQGFAIEHDKPFFYIKSFDIPADYKGKRIILRFDGVYSHARLSINGKFVREHIGGFTRWETDITSEVYIGKKNHILLEVTDRLDDISYASGYAHHPIGGILRNVTLFALPESHLYDVNVETILDSLYKDAELRFICSYVGTKEDKAEVELVLKNNNGTPVRKNQKRFALVNGTNIFSLPVNNPLKWDAEHPHLYNLEINVYKNNKRIISSQKCVGFRKIEIVNERMLVNGKQVKLRGACRHDMHPKLGRTTTAELDSLDVMLFKESNMNFVRTSHYPPSEIFLEYCDRYGIYVESETAVCFVGTHRHKNYTSGATQNAKDYAAHYLNQCKEMVKTFRSHPSILFWSIGNESEYGMNFKLCWNWIKSTDRTRPVVFSYPGTAKEKIYDILSMHYQDVKGNLLQLGMEARNFQGCGMPTLFDEWAHPACYTYSTLQNDPNIREFWGKSLDMMWSGLFDVSGGLGGAIWGYIDETFALPKPKVGLPFWKEFARTAKPYAFQGDCVGYGEWGIVDVWRRQKPEFWSVKKAYSPIRLLADDNIIFTTGQKLTMTVYNRFDHTNLDEIRAIYMYKGVKKILELSPVAPHQKGILTIPPEQWEEGETILIEFFTAGGALIDAYQYTLGKEIIDYPNTYSGETLSVEDDNKIVTIKGEGFEVPFDKMTGLIVNAKSGNEVLIEKGPFLNIYVNLNHLSGAEVRKIADHFTIFENDWKKKNFSYMQKRDGVYLNLSGTYKNVEVNFEIKVTSIGELSINYWVSGLPNGFLREAGLSFFLPESMQQLVWKRKGYWNYYPKEDFAGNKGEVLLYNDYCPAYGEYPRQPWIHDTHNYYYWADAGANCKHPLTQIAKGMKENIFYYIVSSVGNHQLSVISFDATVACRMNKRPDEQLILYVNNRWDYPEIAWGNYCKMLEALPCYGEIKLRMR